MRSVTSSGQPSMTAQKGGLQHYRIGEGDIFVAPLAKTSFREPVSVRAVFL